MEFEEYVNKVVKEIDQDHIQGYLLSTCLGIVRDYTYVMRVEDRDEILKRLGDIYYQLSITSKICDFQNTIIPYEHEENRAIYYIGVLCEIVHHVIYAGGQMHQDMMDIVISNILKELEKDCRKIGKTSSEVIQSSFEYYKNIV